MKKLPSAGSIILILLVFCAMPAYADHIRARIWIGPTWGPHWYEGPRYRYYYPYAYDLDPPPVVIQQPDVYYYPALQAAPVPAPAPAQPSYWYYCRNPKGYYPYVNACPGGWQKVTPTPPPAEPKE